VEEFQMEMITELRKEEERKERKRIRERDKVRRTQTFGRHDDDCLRRLDKDKRLEEVRTSTKNKVRNSL
jgi:hypothetical protein